jgi:hypothetical protein
MTAKFPPALPDHLVKERRHAALNASLKEIEKRFREVAAHWNHVHAELSESISKNEDLASSMLEPLLAGSAAPTEMQLAAAKDRRERGNPPGKMTNPLGDQISWQQFLDAAAGEETVWLVTRDSDFFHADRGNRYLNPFLHAELMSVGVKRVELHDNLASAIKALKMAGLNVARDMSDQKLAELEEEETEAFHPHPPHGIWPDGAWICPNCKSLNNDTPLIPRPSQYGGWSYWTGCSRCGFTLDTGEPYDG